MNSFEPRFSERAEELAAIGSDLYQRGWVPATSGNFSMRLNEQTALVTASGKHKGRLGSDDFLAVDLQGQPRTAGKPSAETLLHTQLYAWQPWIDTVLHCHSPTATVVSRLLPGNELVLADYELLKAFRGVTTHATSLTLPVFENTQDIAALADEVAAYLAQHPDCPAYLIRGHGVYCWGASSAECMRQLEALDFLLQCELLTWQQPQRRPDGGDQ
ncbi:MAG: methylthioribulose 1-phosphate dehydratase [Spongiibacteraceae bacterium]|nr:methylthioribulose 1-phosphate dehydratase [Spongiibacteraceae bacterium]